MKIGTRIHYTELQNEIKNQHISTHGAMCNICKVSCIVQHKNTPYNIIYVQGGD